MQESSEKTELKDENGEDSEEESGVIEYSPCGRWQKRAEKVCQKELSGIDATYLAMDSEEGIEVVWNEIEISMGRNVQKVKDEINSVLLNLVNLTHQYIINFHHYWIDSDRQPPRVIYITEYMSAGSLMSFLRKSQKTVRSSLRTWKRWCGQIVCALMFFHQNKPYPIIHGNLSCDGIFMQHNGIIKICAVAPDAIYRGAKTSRLAVDRLHYIAPEYASESSVIGTSSDIYSFGMCALQLYILISGLSEDSSLLSTKEKRDKLIESIDKPDIKDMISKCLMEDPTLRPTARDLLLHPPLIEIPPLKALVIDRYDKFGGNVLPSPSTHYKSLNFDSERLFGHVGESKHPWTYSQLNKPTFGELIDSVRNGKFPFLCSNLFSCESVDKIRSKSVDHTVSQSGGNIATVSAIGGSTESGSGSGMIAEGEFFHLPTTQEETRLALSVECSIKQTEDSPGTHLLSVLIKFADRTNRQLSCEIIQTDTAQILTRELLDYYLINEADCEKVENAVDCCLTLIISPETSVAAQDVE